jgi:long-chain acyl-CoA synthetase
MSNTLLVGLIQRQAEKYGDRVALRYRNYETGVWVPISWNVFSERVETVAKALLEMGVGVQENIAVFSQNKPECLFVDFGAYLIRAVTIPFYATSSEAQVHYMVNDASVRYVFVGEQLQYDVAFRTMLLNDHIRQIIIFDKTVVRDERDKSSIYFDEFLDKGLTSRHQAEVDKRSAEASNDDLANILYTSGTTGESKGVMLHHSCYDGAIAAHFKRFPELGEDDIIMNFLPFTHVFERAWSYWCIAMGCTLCVNLRPQDISTTIKEVRPTAMCSVPRFWEKVYSGVYELINRSSGVKKALMLDAIKVGRQYNVEYKMKGLTPPTWLSLRYRLYERTVYSLLRKTVGIDRGRFFPTAGAAIPPAVQEFVLSVGINMVAGYGLTESTATVSCEGSVEHCIGSVGKLMPHCQVKIDSETSEILLRGVGITHGYYKKEAVTKEAFTDDGWFHTGDAGYIKDDYLFLTDRIKDLFKTSNGKYIAPQAIESKLVVDRYIDQICIIADQRKFVSALIIPEYKLVEEYAAQHAIAYADRAELLQKPEITALFKERIDTLQQEFAHYEQIKRFTLLPEPFSMSKGELTNTLKIKRAVLNRNYKDVIDKMYAE